MISMTTKLHERIVVYCGASAEVSKTQAVGLDIHE